MIILDTSVAVPLRDGDAEVTARLLRLANDRAISVVTRVELEGGVYRDPTLVEVRRARLDEMLTGISTLAFTEEDADAYGRVLAAVGYSRPKILDRMIAAQAVQRRASVVTLNTADFADVPGLRLANW